MSSTTVRLLTAAAIAVVLAVLLAVVAISAAQGVSLQSPQLVGLLSSVGVLVALIASLVGTNVNAGSVAKLQSGAARIEDKVNGHLEKHLGHTDDQIQAMIDEGIARRLGPPPPAPGG